MARLKPDAPMIEPDCDIENAEFGRFCEVKRGSRVAHSSFGDYSYCDRYCDIANASVGKFANIASFVRIGATDHPLDRAALHHFMYRSADLWDDAENDAAFFAHRRSRRAVIGHDTWIGHNAQIKPEVSVGHGAVVASGAIVTRDVEPYTIVAGTPARVLRLRQPPEIAERLIALAWWDWEHALLRERLDDFRALTAEAFLEKYEQRLDWFTRPESRHEVPPGSARPPPRAGAWVPLVRGLREDVRETIKCRPRVQDAHPAVGHCPPPARDGDAPRRYRAFVAENRPPDGFPGAPHPGGRAMLSTYAGRTAVTPRG